MLHAEVNKLLSVRRKFYWLTKLRTDTKFSRLEVRKSGSRRLTVRTVPSGWPRAGLRRQSPRRQTMTAYLQAAAECDCVLRAPPNNKR
jgi:hypothetical protein